MFKTFISSPFFVAFFRRFYIVAFFRRFPQKEKRSSIALFNYKIFDFHSDISLLFYFIVAFFSSFFYRHFLYRRYLQVKFLL